MGIYLGNVGSIAIARRSSEGGKFSVMNPSDVNEDRNRFSFDFDLGYLISGDLVEIKTTDNTDLDFVSSSGWTNNTVQQSGDWYIHVDELGGIRLYDSFENSLLGGTTGLVLLSTIDRDIPIEVTVRSRDSHLVASVVEYELNTSREAVDITTLSDQHRQQYSGLISGNGRFTAQWDYVPPSGKETVQYLMQLVLRTEIGATFRARMYIKSANTISASGAFATEQLNDELWWEFDAVVTNNATAFTSDQVIVSTIDFVATGPIRLKAKTQTVITEGFLLQEDDFKIRQEQDSDSFLLLGRAE